MIRQAELRRWRSRLLDRKRSHGADRLERRLADPSTSNRTERKCGRECGSPQKSKHIN
jgi:hypothetical protein